MRRYEHVFGRHDEVDDWKHEEDEPRVAGQHAENAAAWHDGRKSKEGLAWSLDGQAIAQATARASALVLVERLI